MEKNNIELKIKKPPFIKGDNLKYLIYVSGGIIGALLVSITTLIIHDKITLLVGVISMIIIILIVLSIMSLITAILYFFSINEFYREYEKQYEYFINKNYINNNNINELKKDIQTIKDKQGDAIYFEEIGEINEETGEITYYNKQEK